MHFLLVGLWFLLVFNVSIDAWVPGEDYNRFGEQLLEHEVILLDASADPLFTLSYNNLSVVQCSVIGRVFGIRPADILKYRRGFSFAPYDHRLNNTRWYTVWFKDRLNAGVVLSRTLRIDDRNIVVGEKVWPLARGDQAIVSQSVHWE